MEGLILCCIIAFTGISGINDGGNLIGTYLNSNTIRPVVSVGLLIVSVLVGPILFGTRVSHTIAVEIINFQGVSHTVLALSLLSAVLTLGVTWNFSIPTSTTMALGGAMIGVALAYGHFSWVHWAGIIKVFGGLLGSVGVGFGIAYGLSWALWALMKWKPAVGFLGRKGQYLTIVLQGLAYGANDQEKAIGLMAIWILLAQGNTAYHVGLWAIVLPWGFWLAGFFFGGLRIARTVSGHIIRLRDMEAVSTQFSAAATVTVAALLGLPVSTTQTTDGAIFGTGASLHPYQVRWGVVGKFFKIWALTLPLAISVGLITTGGARLIHQL